VYNTLLLCQDRIQGKFVRVFTDNTTCAVVINKQFSASQALRPLALAILSLALGCEASIEAYYLPGVMNVYADYLSRVSLKAARCTSGFFSAL
jgi:uncharacterized protein (UPF0276 family)